jgi:hypothetical protein
MLISINAQHFLKILHLLAVSFWVGGAFAIAIMGRAVAGAQSDQELFGIMRAMRFVNVYVVVYLGAFGSFFTGLAYSLCTNRGFFRHKWVIIKWVITLGFIIGGFTLMGPWGGALLDMVHADGLAAMYSPEYQAYASYLFMMQMLEFSGFFLAFILSVYKPWERQELVDMPMTMRRR